MFSIWLFFYIRTLISYLFLFRVVQHPKSIEGKLDLELVQSEMEIKFQVDDSVDTCGNIEPSWNGSTGHEDIWNSNVVNESDSISYHECISSGFLELDHYLKLLRAWMHYNGGSTRGKKSIVI